MSGLHERFDEIVADVPVYGDLDRAIEQADRERRRRYGSVAGLVAAAAVLAVIVGVLAVSRDGNDSPQPIGPTPTPTPTFASPGPQDHPIAIAAVGDALLLVTMDQLERLGSATVWRSESGRWQELGMLKNAIPLHWKKDSDFIGLSPGPGTLDIIARERDAHNVGFSRDGGATWSYLAYPRECSECWIQANGDHLYAWDGHNEPNALFRAPFGAAGWEEVRVPPFPVPENGYTPPLLLKDGTLVVSQFTIDDHDDHCPGPYRVSRDHGTTWSGLREAPTGACIQGFVGKTLCASDFYAGREFRSTDLVHWELVQAKPCFSTQPPAQDLPAACSRQDPAYRWVSDPPLAVGEDVFRLFHVDDRDPWRNRVMHVLKVSHDDCRTWQKALP